MTCSCGRITVMEEDFLRKLTSLTVPGSPWDGQVHAYTEPFGKVCP